MKRSFFLLAFFTSLVVLLGGLSSPVKAAPIGNYLELFGGYLKTVSLETSSPAGFTFEAWIKPEGVSGIQKIISIGDKKISSLHYEIGINGGSLSLHFRYDRNSQIIVTAGNLEASIWSHIAVVISPQHSKLFINGQPIITAWGAVSLLPLGENIVVGNSYLTQSATNAFKGAVDEIRISTTARDIASLWTADTYENPLPADSVTFVLWHLDEARGEMIAYDASGENHHATLEGGDSQIHFFGILPTPTPTPFSLPTIRWLRPVLPTLTFPTPRVSYPTSFPPPSQSSPAPTSTDIRGFPRQDRPSHR